MRLAFVLAALAAAFAAVALIARSERVYSADEVRSAFAEAGIDVSVLDAFLPGCERRVRFDVQPEPRLKCLDVIWVGRGDRLAVYVFRSPSDRGRFVDRVRLDAPVVEERANVLVLAERRGWPLEKALAGLG